MASRGQLPAGLRKQVAGGGSLQKVMIAAGSSETFSCFLLTPGNSLPGDSRSWASGRHQASVKS